MATIALARDLAERLKGLASISDQSGGRTVLRISGPRARDVLAKGLPIDLDPRGFPLGSAATSTISLMGVQLWQTGDPQSYDIAIFRSVSAELLALAYQPLPPSTATRSHPREQPAAGRAGGESRVISAERDLSGSGRAAG